MAASCLKAQNLLALSDREMQRIRGNRIGMIFQEPMTSLNPVLTIERQLTESLETHLEMGRAAARRRAVELLEMVGIPDPHQRIKEHPHRLSGGMRQRVMIAMALSCNPNLIIADEPTTAVDVTIQAQLLELMKSLTRELNVALIIISHNMGIVARYVDRVFIMYSGKIVESGPVAETFRSPQHPYTLGLLRSIPRLDLPRRDVLESIPGQPPDLAFLPKGCAFRERCTYAVDRCAEEDASAGRSDQQPAGCLLAGPHLRHEPETVRVVNADTRYHPPSGWAEDALPRNFGHLLPAR